MNGHIVDTAARYRHSPARCAEIDTNHSIKVTASSDATSQYQGATSVVPDAR